MAEFISSQFLPFIRSIRITDVIDILVVAFIIYNAIKLIRQTRAAQLIKGIAIILVVMYLSEWLQLNVIHFILTNTIQVGITALLIVFQPELRRALEHVGRSKFSAFFAKEGPSLENDIIDEVCIAAAALSKTKTGALIVFERKTVLGDMLTGGTVINSEITSEILENIFVPNTPLHDGAVIIKDGKISKAATVLPLCSNKNLSKEFGTRHRAALGVSEMSDAIALVVSEETGKISVTVNGDMLRNLSVSSLSALLSKLLVNNESEKLSKGIIFRRSQK